MWEGRVALSDQQDLNLPVNCCQHHNHGVHWAKKECSSSQGWGFYSDKSIVVSTYCLVFKTKLWVQKLVFS